MKRIWIIGIGMGNPETLTVGALNRIQASQALIGARRMIEALGEVKAKAYFAVSPDEILQWIKDHEDLDPISVLMSGDVGFFSGAKKLLKLIEEETNYKAELIPGISSLQIFLQPPGDFLGRRENRQSPRKRTELYRRDSQSQKDLFLDGQHSDSRLYLCPAGGSGIGRNAGSSRRTAFL